MKTILPTVMHGMNEMNLNHFDAFNHNTIIVLEDLWCNSYVSLCYVSFMWVCENNFNDHMHNSDLHKEYQIVTWSVLSLKQSLCCSQSKLLNAVVLAT